MALWLKYPNPFSTHVLADDIVDRHVDQQGRLHTTRILLKSGSVPGWIQNWIKSTEAYVVEESIVDPQNGLMETRTRNLSHQRIFVVEELQTYTRSPDNSLWTRVDTRARFRCTLRWVGARIEGLGASRFREHMHRSRQALTYVLERLRTHGIASFFCQSKI